MPLCEATPTFNPSGSGAEWTNVDQNPYFVLQRHTKLIKTPEQSVPQERFRILLRNEANMQVAEASNLRSIWADWCELNEVVLNESNRLLDDVCWPEQAMFRVLTFVLDAYSLGQHPRTLEAHQMNRVLQTPPRMRGTAA
mmetsp:Transcript_22325/g.36925  ORF Transcript_22325/g.36925 Transcript_22325/m.36925 type:complete len:140 (+) Transcript_22325:336-755(+)|eukprot:CAMPEP_0184658826 /NCGR_PEP_ID=MMETSP0308-20130426/27001_1 /TAXON_ID=38269 /ORGANISM="Gloeochaete witrockiana, Strain SAG 46.84" /LENGTH=139 /DNA_ID=CAMNT_0027098121 /DNA_START=237 /DNA_END=656 /DNA_ORIENTATION=+